MFLADPAVHSYMTFCTVDPEGDPEISYVEDDYDYALVGKEAKKCLVSPDVDGVFDM